MRNINRSLTATIRLHGKCMVGSIKGLMVTVLSMNGTEVRPTKLKISAANTRRRGNKLYGNHGVYTIVD